MLLSVTWLAVACTETETNDGAIVGSITDGGQSVKLSEILASHALIPLETTESSLVGTVSKIVKRDGVYYLASDRKNIQAFGSDGKHIGTIDRIGGGPGEYVQLIDFDVDGDRIAVLDLRKVHFYTLDGSFDKTIDLPVIGSNLKLLPDGNIMLTTSREDDAIAVVNRAGKEIARYVKSTQPLLLKKSIPFIECDGKVFFQNGAYANDLWYYQNGKTGTARLLGDPDALSAEQEEKLVEESGLDYAQNNMTALKINGISAWGKQMAFVSLKQDNAYLYIHDFTTNHDVRYEMMPTMSITDDITYMNPGLSLGMITIGASENGFVSLLQPYVLAEALDEHADQAGTPTYDAARQLLDSLGDADNANPILFEFNFK